MGRLREEAGVDGSCGPDPGRAGHVRDQVADIAGKPAADEGQHLGEVGGVDVPGAEVFQRAH
jgi:hypothetical protein